MSKKHGGSVKIKSKRPSLRTRSSNSDVIAIEGLRGHDGLFNDDGGQQETSLPPQIRARLWQLFSQIEREVEIVYAENLALREQIEAMNEKVDPLSGERGVDDLDAISGAGKTGVGKKPSTSQLMSKKLITTYKASTSKLVSSFRIPNPAPNTECHRLKSYVGHKDGIWEVRYAQQGPPIIGTASADRTARLWSVESAQCILKYVGHGGSVNSLRFHPTEPLVCTGSGDNTCHIWRKPVSIPEQFLRVRTGSPIVNDGFSRSGSGDEQDIYTDDEGSGDNLEGHSPSIVKSPVCELRGHEGVVMAADWFPDGKKIVTASWDRTAKLWDVEAAQCVHTLTGHDQEITNACTHPNQSLVVTSSRDTTFRLWDFRSPPIHSVNVFQGHANTVTSAVFTTKDNIVSGSDDRTVKVWDVKNMRSPLTTVRTDSPVNRLSVSPTQNLIAIPHDNRYIRIFDLSAVRLARLPRRNRQGHQRMVSCAAWGDDGPNNKGCNLFSAGFDKKVLGWFVGIGKELSN